MSKKKLFPGQDNDEKIVLTLRRHWFIPLKYVLFFSLLLVLPLGAYLFFHASFISCLKNDYIHALTVLGISLYYLYVCVFFFNAWVDYYLDVWIVTDKRIVNIYQNGLFSRTISEQKLYRVQDVTAQVKGIIPTFLNFGNVYIQTAAEEERFIFRQVSHPYAVSRKILQLCNYTKKMMRLQDEMEANRGISTKTPA